MRTYDIENSLKEFLLPCQTICENGTESHESLPYRAKDSRVTKYKTNLLYVFEV
ncbi:MAG: Unknown protein [uncultured Sulfurovum sp.]|uniref:Uncharacterized protein n=1 Tax=uncultured Sulfurovum sp. TaxID=269237 RepID=A0A6S6TGN7_9BACT|nr:MAG: Unknown protein [uncultured Sulfurovum sp.]